MGSESAGCIFSVSVIQPHKNEIKNNLKKKQDYDSDSPGRGKKKKKGGKKCVQMDVTHKELPGLQSWT